MLDASSAILWNIDLEGRAVFRLYILLCAYLLIYAAFVALLSLCLCFSVLSV